MSTAAVDFEELIVSPGFIADPYPAMKRMREIAPVYWSDAIGGWVLTRFDDILVSFKDTAHFSNEGRLGKAIAYLTPEKRANYRAFEEHFSHKSLLHSDPPDHTRMRKLIARELNSTVVEDFKPTIQAAVDRMIDAAMSTGRMEIVSEFASPLPISVIAQILGVPHKDHHNFKRWADDLLAFQGVNKPSEDDLMRANEAVAEMRPYIRDLMEQRRRNPQPDLITKFAQDEAEGGKISEEELVSTCVTLCIAGQETTISFISNSIYTLLSHQDQLDLLRQEPELLTSALEESLRYECPVSRQPRLMKADIELRGQKIKKGEMVFQMVNAANRDPEVFPNPDVFDIRREPNRHVAFGFGIHFCVGALLARAEAAIAIGTLLRRMPNLRLENPQPDWDLEKRNSRVLRTLDVRF